MTITIEKIKERLLTLGYDVDEQNTQNLLELVLPRTIIEVQHYLHRKVIPEDAEPFVIDWVCGSFFLQLFGMGKLMDLDYPLAPVSSVRAGDTQITYATYEKTSAFHQMVDDLLQHSKDVLQYWRVLKTW